MSELPAKKVKQDVEPETKTVKKAMAFKSLAETLKVDWKSGLYAKRVKRMDPSYFLLQVTFISNCLICFTLICLGAVCLPGRDRLEASPRQPQN